ncbi:MAG: ABC transporter ATP-binding protein [Armatimonadia bacterium]
MTALLTLQSVTRRFDLPSGAALTVLEEVSVSFEAGATAAIIGPSGSGKSTLLNLIGALDQPTSGRILLRDIEVTALQGADLAAYRAAHVGFVFQEHHLLPQLSAVENVLLPTMAVGAEAEVAERAEGLLQQVGLSDRLDAFPGQLSGGERQRVALARALVNAPELLLCDEPTGNLDHDTGAEVVTLLLDLAAKQGVTVLMVTHNLEQAQRFGQRWELREGKLISLPAQGGQGGGEPK